MNTAIVLAGGIGRRVGKDIPKQFIEVEGKPILVYTLEEFQRHPSIDAIEVVCVDGWLDTVKGYAEKYHLSKLKWIIHGGETAQESIRNGVYHLEEICGPQDMIIIHDGIRPFIDDSVLNDVIDVCRDHGNAVTAMPYNEQIFLTEDAVSTVQYIPRETIRRVSTPQAYQFQLLDEKYHEAFEKKIGIYGSSYANTMMTDLGVRLFFSKGSDKNMKLTTPEDLELFRVYMRMKKEQK